MSLHQCLKCQAYTLVDKAGPVPVGVDVAEASAVAYAGAVILGLGVYAAEKRQNGDYRLRSARPGTLAPSFDANGAQIGVQRFHVEHAHPVHAQRPVKPKIVGARRNRATTR